MKFECNQDKFKEAISLASRFTSRTHNLPILQTILLSAIGGEVVIRATNLECGVEVVVPAKVATEGVVAVSGSTLGGFVGNLFGEKSLVCRLDGNILRLESQKAKAALKTFSYDEFPSLPTVPAEKSFTLRGADFAKLIRAVGFCASVSGIKPELQSILLIGEASKVTAVATDSFRLAEKSVPAKKVSGFPPLLLPIKNAAELARILDAVAEDVEVYYDEHQLSLRSGGMYYTTRLIEGSFPNYKAVLPKSYTTEAVVLKEDLANAFKLIAVFADKFAQVHLATDPKGKTLTLMARNADIGENTVTLKASLEGDKAEMTFNGRYLADGLQGFAGESVRFGFSGVGKPLAMTGAGDSSYLYIVMPMNR